MRKNNKVLIIIISVVFILAIASAVFAYLFIMTDVFKSNQELFAKYITQSVESVSKITDFETIKIYENLKKENKYESKTDIEVTHSEGGEVSHSLNNISAELDIQKNEEEQYAYAYGKILYGDETYLQAEVIKEQDAYGVRLAEAAKQFITIKNDEQFETVADNIGIEPSNLETIINVIDGNQELNLLSEKYLNIITTVISNGTFERQKDAVITYNNVTTKTNAYSVTLSSEQVENMLVEILNNVKTETEILNMIQIVGYKEQVLELIDKKIAQINEEIEIPDTKLIVYENKQKTIRTEIQMGLDKITIENAEQDGEIKTNIKYSKLSDEQTKEYVCDISKNNIENQENLEVIVNATEGIESYEITLSSQIQVVDNEIQFNIEVSHKKDITTISLKLANKVSIGNDFEKTQSLAQSNIVLNNGTEEMRKTLADMFKKMIEENIYPKIDTLKGIIGMKDEETENIDIEEIPQVEINKFNAKFEFYTGDEVSAENVETLLDIVKNNLESYEITEIQNEEETGSVIPQDKKINIKMNIEKDKVDEEGINEILQKIDSNKKYKILIFYDETNGLIDYITITEK